jgi:hypothetical protein
LPATSLWRRGAIRKGARGRRAYATKSILSRAHQRRYRARTRWEAGERPRDRVRRDQSVRRGKGPHRRRENPDAAEAGEGNGGQSNPTCSRDKFARHQHAIATEAHDELCVDGARNHQAGNPASEYDADELSAKA